MDHRRPQATVINLALTFLLLTAGFWALPATGTYAAERPPTDVRPPVDRADTSSLRLAPRLPILLARYSPVEAASVSAQASPSRSPLAPTATSTFWSVETVDGTAGVGAHTSLEIDAAGEFHVSYHDGNNTALKYAHWDGVAWVTETVDNSAAVGQYTSLDLDSRGNPHISYYDQTNTALKHAYPSRSGWISETVDSNGSVGQYTSLVIESDDDLHITYFDATSETLKYAYWNGSSWNGGWPDSQTGVGRYSSLALVGSYPRISYLDHTNKSLRYATYGGPLKGWNFTDVNGVNEGGAATSLALDSSNHPHISFYRESPLQLKYAHYNGSSWSERVLDTVGGEGMNTSLAVDGGDRPHIAYNDDGSNALMYASVDSSVWFSETVDASGTAAGYPSIALDADGYPHIVYRTTEGLKHAWLQPCFPGEILDVNGPSTVLLGSNPTFTATVLPPTTTVPITVTWKYDDWEGDFDNVVPGTEDVFTFPIAVGLTGTHFLNVTVENCGGTLSVEREVLVEEPALPDLRMSDNWPQGDEIWYQISNWGEITATAGYTVSFQVDGEMVDYHSIAVALAPGHSTFGSFPNWNCSDFEDSVVVTADAGGLVDEEDESNNSRQRTWQCDREGPVFTWGPTVSTITADWVVIEWGTDELSSSGVMYGDTAGEYIGSESDLTHILTHEITLTGLTPSTPYHYFVISSDPGGHQSHSEDFFFETAPPSATIPIIIATTITPADPYMDVYVMTTDVGDSDDVDRVTYYYVEGVSTPRTIGTDYSPDGKGQYEGVLNPKASGFSPGDFFNHPASIKTKVYSRAGLPYIQLITMEPQRDSIPVDVEITFPEPGYTFYITDTVAPPGSLLDVMGYAAEYEWQCTWGGAGSSTPEDLPDCGDVAVPVDHVRLYLNDIWVANFNPGGDGLHQYYTLDLSGKPPGQYTLKAQARDSYNEPHEVEIDFSIVLREPSIHLERNVTPVGQAYHVALTIENQLGAMADARISRIVDNTRGFQVADKGTSNYAIASTLDPEDNPGWFHEIIVDFYSMPSNPYIELAPGESFVVEYDLVPILGETPVGIYAIGGADVVVHHGGSAGDSQQEAFSLGSSVTYWDTLDRIAQADYVIVTHPRQLYGRYTDTEVDELMTLMAALAKEQGGVLGYLTSEDPRETLDALIEPGGAWANQLHPDFSTYGGGYLLIVGETEIVPDWWESVGDREIAHSDQRYSNLDSTDNPFHSVGRIIGNDPTTLMTPLRNTVGMLQGTTTLGFDRSHAFVLSGTGGGQRWFRDNAQHFANLLTAQGTDVTAIYGVDYYVADSFPFVYNGLAGFAAGDVDGDGWDEMVIASASNDFISIVGGDGFLDGAFTRPEFNDTFEQGDRLTVADMGGDAAEEIIIGDKSNGCIWMYDDNGGLFNFTCVGFSGGELAVGDADDDGANEFIIYPTADDHIYGYAKDGTLLYDFARTHGSGELLTAADVIYNVPGAERGEIILADQDADRIFFYNITGTVVYSQTQRIDVGDTVASGNVSPWGHDEVLLGDVDSHTVYTFRWGSDQKMKQEWHPYLASLSSSSDVAAGNVSGDDLEEILVAEPSGNQLLITDRGYCDRLADGVETSGGLEGADILLYRGHGSPDGWGCGLNVDDFPRDFGTAAPFGWGTTCLSGRYEGDGEWGFAEEMMASNVVGYVGATQVSGSEPNFEGGKLFFDLWDGTRSLGKAFLDTETEQWIGNNQRYWVYEYNYYGDPKFGNVPMTPGLAQRAEATTTALTSLTLDVPTYTVTSGATFDEVAIPGGQLLLAEGEYAIPFWYASFDYPAGQTVQDVVLVGRSGLITETGLNLPVAVVEEHPNGTGTTLALGPAPSPPPEDWQPDAALQYEWSTQSNPDGSSTLLLKVYPFHYHPLRTTVEFYQNFTFSVDLYPTTVSVASLGTDADVYAQADEVRASMWVSNTGPAQDVLVVATVRDGTTGELVDGLPLRNMHELGGWGSLDLVWDSSGFSPGHYAIRVELRDMEGHLLDQSAAGFQLGITSGAITALTATPSLFRIGDAIDITMEFKNTGSLPITGTAYMWIQTADEMTVTQTFTYPVAGLAPGAAVTFNEVWDTSGAAEGEYQVYGTVAYSGGATPVERVDLSTRQRIYLPVVLRSGP